MPEIRVTDEITLEVSRVGNPKYLYTYYLSSLDHLDIVDGKLNMVLIDSRLEVQVPVSLVLYRFRDGFLVENQGLYERKLIASYFIHEDIPFEFIRIHVDQYNSVIYNKETHLGNNHSSKSD